MNFRAIVCVVFSGFTAPLLSGCGSSSPASLPMTATGQAPDSARRFSTLFSFSGSDGDRPLERLVTVGDVFYGVTVTGGRTGKCDESSGCGLVYSISANGSEATVYKFAGAPNGAQPAGGLIAVNGILYGTTIFGGKGGKNCGSSLGCGTVFSVTPAGAEHVIHSFTGSDGNRPSAGLIAVHSTLYGTTAYGGTHGEGTVFSMTTTGTEHVLYNFGDSSLDAQQPGAPLLYLDGALYGTTPLGGTGTDCYSGSGGCGTVFVVTMTGKETVLHAFAGGTDGSFPSGGLTAVNGSMYGTTSEGGAYYRACYSRYSGDCGGTVYSLTTTGKERVVHNFGGAGDGISPSGDLLDLKGKLYGVTGSGGQHGFGTVFALSTSGTERVIHTFEKAHQGGLVPSGIAALNDRLYGTTAGGGDGNDGTVFTLRLL